MFLIGVIALYGWPSLAELFYAVKDGFVGETTISTVLETKLSEPLTALWSELWRWFTDTLAPLTFTDMKMILSILAMFALLVLAYAFMTGCAAVFAVVSLAMYLVANSAFILLLAIGPFFLLCLSFPFLQRFFETYIGNVMTSIFAMAFTVLMISFVANLFGLTNIHTVVPLATDLDTVSDMAKQMAVLFAAKGAMSLLIIYLTYKVFDLAAALGGGLNMGNNLVGGVRGILRDLQRSAGSGSSRNSTTNTVSQGNAPGGRSASGRASRANSTFTGMAASAAGSAISAAGKAGIRSAQFAGQAGAQGAQLAGRAAVHGALAVGQVGRYAYNRYAQHRNRMSAG
jgi:type IV secretion system protein VirB6